MVNESSAIIVSSAQYKARSTMVKDRTRISLFWRQNSLRMKRETKIRRRWWMDDQPGGEAEDGAHGWWIGMVGTLAWQQLLQEPHDEALGHPGRQTEGAGKGETVLS